MIKESNETPEKLHGAGVELLTLGFGIIGMRGLCRLRKVSATSLQPEAANLGAGTAS